MPIEMILRGDNAELFLNELRGLMPALVGAAQLPPMQEQPNRDPIVTNTARPGDKPGSRTRTRKGEELPSENVKEVKTEAAGEPAGTSPESSGATSNTESSKDPSDSKSSEASAVPDIEDLRARLKTLGATEGFGTDKVFEVLGKYGAKNASTVPEEKRAACIAEIDELLKGGAK